MNRAWLLALLALVLGACALYVVVGARAQDNFQNDSAYYFGVARHIALTHRVQEPIVWHYLRPPATILHPAFDYWGGLTSLVLAPILAVFGATGHVAFIAMALISAASLIAFAYLVVVAAPTRHPLMALLAVAVFAFSPGMAVYRFDTESIPLYHLLLILSLVAFARSRYALATLCAALLVFTRPDGVFTCIAVFVASLIMLREKPRKAWYGVIGAAAGAASVYVVYNLVSFGTVTTQASRALFIFSQPDLYAFGPHAGASLDKLKILFSFKYVWIRLLMILQALRLARLVPYPDAWVALAFFAGLLFWRRSAPVARLAWVALFASLFLVAWSEPAVFAPWRSFHPRLPLLVLAGAYGLDALATWAAERLKRPEPALTVALLVPSLFVVAQLRIYGKRALATNHDEIVELRRLDATLAGRPVASDLPWYVIANTSSPAISIPGNGPDAMVAAFAKYNVEWLLFGGRHSSTARSTATLSAIAHGKQSTLGPYRLERVPAGAGVQLFHLER